MLSLDHLLAVDKGASRQFYAKKGKKKKPGGFAKKKKKIHFRLHLHNETPCM